MALQMDSPKAEELDDKKVQTMAALRVVERDSWSAASMVDAKGKSLVAYWVSGKAVY